VNITMHIALNAWFWDQPYTGSGQYVRRLTAALRAARPDLKLTLVTPPRITAPEGVPEGVAVYRAGGIGGKVGKVLFEQRGFPNVARAVGADLVHVPYWGPPLASPVPLIVSVLDVIPLVMKEYSGSLASSFYTSLVTAGARGASHIITISNDSKNDIVAQLGAAADDVTVTYLAVDDVFHPRLGAERDEAVRAKYNLPDRFVLYLGGFDVRKQVNELLLAYTYVTRAEGDQVPLVLAGREPEWGGAVFPDLRQYAHDLGLDEIVQWVNAPDDADKPSLYRLAAAHVWPSRKEGFGLPVLESMACGTPTIAWNAPVIQEIVGDGAYLVDSAREMAGAILAVLGETSLRNTLVNQGLAQVTRYSWRKTARETAAVYDHVLAAVRTAQKGG
jgi:glycosyltransferase involved in cell wall biosynthesis